MIIVFEANVRFDLPAKDPFVRHFPRKKKMKIYTGDGIVINARSYGLSVIAPIRSSLRSSYPTKTSTSWEESQANKVEEYVFSFVSVKEFLCFYQGG